MIQTDAALRPRDHRQSSRADFQCGDASPLTLPLKAILPCSYAGSPRDWLNAVNPKAIWSLKLAGLNVGLLTTVEGSLQGSSVLRMLRKETDRTRFKGQI